MIVSFFNFTYPGIIVVGMYWPVIVLVMVGKFVVAPAFVYIYMVTIELYPTQVSVVPGCSISI